MLKITSAVNPAYFPIFAILDAAKAFAAIAIPAPVPAPPEKYATAMPAKRPAVVQARVFIPCLAIDADCTKPLPIAFLEL